MTPPVPGLSFLVSQTLAVLGGGCGSEYSAHECPQGAGVCSVGAQALPACPAGQSQVSQVLCTERGAPAGPGLGAACREPLTSAGLSESTWPCCGLEGGCPPR